MKRRNLICLILILFLLMGENEGEAETDSIYIQISFSEKKLVVFQEGKLIKEFPIAVPKGNYYSLPLKGRVVKIIENPWWYPTPNIQKEYFKKKKIFLPHAIPPGDPRNAMGKVKFLLYFENFSRPIRIHGTNDPNSIGRKVTHGCIRLRNEDALELKDLLKEHLPVSVEIIF